MTISAKQSVKERGAKQRKQQDRTYSPRGGLAQGLRGLGQHHLELETEGKAIEELEGRSVQVVPAPVILLLRWPQKAQEGTQGRSPLQETQASASCSQMLAPLIGREVTD